MRVDSLKPRRTHQLFGRPEAHIVDIGYDASIVSSGPRGTIPEFTYILTLWRNFLLRFPVYAAALAGGRDR